MKQKVHKNTIGFVVCWPAPCPKVSWYTQWCAIGDQWFSLCWRASGLMRASPIRSVLKLESLIQCFLWHTVLTVMCVCTAMVWSWEDSFLLSWWFFLLVWVWGMELRCHPSCLLSHPTSRNIVISQALPCECLHIIASSGTSVCTSLPAVAPHDLKEKTLKLLYLTNIKVISILASPGSILLYLEEGSCVEFSHASLTGLGCWSRALACLDCQYKP